jgi:hypothetical protein
LRDAQTSATDQVLETNEAFAESFDKGELFLPKTDERGALVYDVKAGRLSEVVWMRSAQVDSSIG